MCLVMQVLWILVSVETLKSYVNCCIANVADLQKSTEFLLNSLFDL